MNTIVSAIITASATLIGIFIVETLYGKRIFNRLEKHDETDYLKHQQLANQHTSLLNNTNNILDANKEIKTKLYDVDVFLKTEKEKKSIQFENLTDKQKEMKQSIDKLSAFSDEFQRLSILNAKLLREVESLTQENNELRLHNRRLRDYINDLERDEQYEL